MFFRTAALRAVGATREHDSVQHAGGEPFTVTQGSRSAARSASAKRPHTVDHEDRMTAAQPLTPQRPQAVQPERKHAGDGEAGDETSSRKTRSPSTVSRKYHGHTTTTHPRGAAPSKTLRPHNVRRTAHKEGGAATDDAEHTHTARRDQRVEESAANEDRGPDETTHPHRARSAQVQQASRQRSGGHGRHAPRPKTTHSGRARSAQGRTHNEPHDDDTHNEHHDDPITPNT